MRRPAPPPALVGSSRSLLDLVDNVLTRGITLSGDVTLGIAHVDLVYLRLQALLCAADRIFDTGERRAPGRATRLSGGAPRTARPQPRDVGWRAPDGGAPAPRRPEARVRRRTSRGRDEPRGRRALPVRGAR
jgi:gas vesicle structural protein